MLKTKAVFHRKETEFETQDCVIEKIVRLNSDDFFHFKNNLMDKYDFIRDYANQSGITPDGISHCLLVLDRDGEDGIIVRAEGAAYARYSAFMPGAKYFVEACQQTQNMKFYCPLQIGTYDNPRDAEYGVMNELQGIDSKIYEDNIREAIIHDYRQDGKKGLALCVDTELQDKVTSILPDIELSGDTLYGVFNVETVEELTPQELETLRNLILGEAADGWGDEFEQQPIETRDGDIYVSFGHKSKDYFMLTGPEFEQRHIMLEQASAFEEPSVYQKFKEKVRQNFADYMEQWQALHVDELIKRAEEIALTKEVYISLTGGGWDMDYAEYLIWFENPLEVVRDQYRTEQELNGNTEMAHVLWKLLDKPDIAQDYPLDESYVPPGQSQDISM